MKETKMRTQILKGSDSSVGFLLALGRWARRSAASMVLAGS